MPRIGEHTSQTRIKAGDELDMLAEGPLQQFQHTGHYLVEVQHPRLDHLAAGERQEPVG